MRILESENDEDMQRTRPDPNVEYPMHEVPGSWVTGNAALQTPGGEGMNSD